jgi:hypothetical protein
MFNPLQDCRIRIPVASLDDYLVGASLTADEIVVHPDSVTMYLYRVGADALAISELPDGDCYLQIQNEEYTGPLDELELILAEWAATEGYFDSPLLSEPLTIAAAWLTSDNRSDILAVLQSLDPNGSWRDSEAIADGLDFMTLDDARAALANMLAQQ